VQFQKNYYCVSSLKLQRRNTHSYLSSWWRNHIYR